MLWTGSSSQKIRELYSGKIVLIETSVRRVELVRMPEKKAVKIIKKHERVRRQKPAPKGNSTAQTAREMVKTVTNWVNELQQKRRVETTSALKLMMPKNPRASEA